MKALSLTSISFAVLGLLYVAAPSVANAAQKQAANPYECLTDDGYGRKRPCSADYQPKRADKKNYDCFTDDGYGRMRPCAAGVKR